MMQAHTSMMQLHKMSSSEKHRQSARVLLAVARRVGGEERVVADIEAQDDALLEHQRRAAAGVERELRLGSLGDAVDLGEGGGAAAAQRGEGHERPQRLDED